MTQETNPTKTASSSENLFDNVLSQNQNQNPNPDPGQTEEPKDQEEIKAEHLARLKERATLMGIKFSNNIGLDALKARIEAKLNGEAESSENQNETQSEANTNPEATSSGNEDAPAPASSPPTAPKSEKPKSLRQLLYEREMKLVRLRITNLDPKKKDLPGEIFTFANEVLGSVRKYIPYGEATDNGYHVPYCIYKQLKAREFVNVRTRKDNRGRIHVESGMAREFALEILPDLTPEELARLAAQQAAAKGLND